MKIGIDNTSRSPCVGSLILAVVQADENFFRKFSGLKIVDSKLLTRKQRDDIVRKTMEHVKFFNIHYIKPIDMENENLNDLEVRGVIWLLNSIKEFWKHDIYIDNTDKTKDKFLERMDRLMPKNLKKVLGNNIEELRESTKSWKVENHADANYKIVSISSIYAKFFSDLEMDEIRQIYPEVGSGSPSDPKTIKYLITEPYSPWIRRTWITWRRLQQYPELKEILLNKINNKTFDIKELKELYKKYEMI